jgi:hypothetical protein
MADPASLIEALENRWIRAWTAGDTRELKALTARDFILLIGSKPAMILDPAQLARRRGQALDLHVVPVRRRLCAPHRRRRFVRHPGRAQGDPRRRRLVGPDVGHRFVAQAAAWWLAHGPPDPVAGRGGSQSAARHPLAAAMALSSPLHRQ